MFLWRESAFLDRCLNHQTCKLTQLRYIQCPKCRPEWCRINLSKWFQVDGTIWRTYVVITGRFRSCLLEFCFPLSSFFSRFPKSHSSLLSSYLRYHQIFDKFFTLHHQIYSTFTLLAPTVHQSTVHYGWVQNRKIWWNTYYLWEYC
jgi:hypothetical protein